MTSREMHSGERKLWPRAEATTEGVNELSLIQLIVAVPAERKRKAQQFLTSASVIFPFSKFSKLLVNEPIKN